MMLGVIIMSISVLLSAALGLVLQEVGLRRRHHRTMVRTDLWQHTRPLTVIRRRGRAS